MTRRMLFSLEVWKEPLANFPMQHKLHFNQLLSLLAQLLPMCCLFKPYLKNLLISVTHTNSDSEALPSAFKLIMPERFRYFTLHKCYFSIC